MSLDLSCIKYVGRRLYVQPHGGWGWAGTDWLPIEHQKDGMPLPFRAKVLQFLSHRDDVRGGVISGAIGVVDEPEHYLDGSWIRFRTRGHKGNFTKRLIHYNIDIGWSDRELRGYGIIAETPSQVEYWWENWQQLHSRPNTFVDEDLLVEVTKLLQEFKTV